MSIAQQVGSRATCDEVQLQFGVMMPPVRTRGVGIAPSHAIEIYREFEALQHGDKK
jgi:hypothetical protein